MSDRQVMIVRNLYGDLFNNRATCSAWNHIKRQNADLCTAEVFSKMPLRKNKKVLKTTYNHLARSQKLSDYALRYSQKEGLLNFNTLVHV